MLSPFFISKARYLSTTNVSSIWGGASKYQSSFKAGAFYPELPEGKKPTHIIVGAGSAGCVLVS